MRESHETPPFIEKGFDDYLVKLTLGKPDQIHPDRKFTAYQAFYAGFSRACALLANVHAEDREVLLEQIKLELRIFSAASRELGRETGLGHVRVHSDPSKPALHHMDGGKPRG